MTSSSKLLRALGVTAAILLSACGDEVVQNMAVVDAPSVSSKKAPAAPITAERVTEREDGSFISHSSACYEDIRDGGLAQALATGDISHLPEGEATTKLIKGEIERVDSCDSERQTEIRRAIFDLDGEAPLTALTWYPTHDAAMLRPQGGASTLFQTNATNASRTDVTHTLGTAATIGSARTVALGGHPLRNIHRSNGEVGEQVTPVMKNIVQWLAKGTPSKIVIAQSDDSFYFRDYPGTKSWLETHYGTDLDINDYRACDGANLASCLDGTDLLVISSKVYSDGTDEARTAFTASVEDALTRGISVLYMHHDGGRSALTDPLLGLLRTEYAFDNYWARLKLQDFDVTDLGETISPNRTQSRTMIEKLMVDDFTFDPADCEESALCASGTPFRTEFWDDMEQMRKNRAADDAAGRNIFGDKARRADQLVQLMADHWRRDIRYPMDKSSSPRRDILRAFWAEAQPHIARPVNPVQPDLGNLSRTDFSHITPTSQTVNVLAKRRMKAAGVYALPGQSFSVTRLDDSEVGTRVQIHTLRSGATRWTRGNGYNRPRFPTSPAVNIAPGQTITLTSPYGGPVQILFDANDVDTSFRFERVGQHPIWRGPEDDAAFADALNAGEYDWAEIITPAFQVHSTLEKMRTSVQNPNFTGAAALAAGTQHYMHDLPHGLAGFQGPGITPIPDIADWASDRGIALQNLDVVKHMNADQATCGAGCSGNPYDAYWDYDPLGHGDLHELGHGLERGKFRFAGQEGHTVTNPYSYYSKWKFYQTSGINYGCQNLPVTDMFDLAQASVSGAKDMDTVRAESFTRWSRGAAVNFQMMAAAQKAGAVSDGWHILGRLHVLEREFNIADNSDELWAASADKLGFSGWSRTDARALSNDDWLLVSWSLATGLDMTAYLEMWGIELTEATKTHVADMGLPAMPMEFFAFERNGQCTGLDVATVPLDGTSKWPEAAAAQRQRAGTSYSDPHLDHHHD